MKEVSGNSHSEAGLEVPSSFGTDIWLECAPDAGLATK